MILEVLVKKNELREDSFYSRLLTEVGSTRMDLLKLDSVGPFLINLDDRFSSLLSSSFGFITFVRLGLLGASVDEFGRSSDELAFD